MDSRLRGNDMRRPGIPSAAENKQFMSSGPLSPARGVGLDGRDGGLEPGLPAVWLERNQFVVDAGRRGGEAMDVGGLAGIRIGALDRVPDLSQQFGVERGGPECVAQALRALVEQQPSRAGAAHFGERFEKLNAPWNASGFVLQDRFRAKAHEFGKSTPREFSASLPESLGQRHRCPLFVSI